MPLLASRPEVTPPDRRAASHFVSLENGRSVVWLEGEQDLATDLALLTTLAKLASMDDAGLVIDMSGVTFLGASTIGLLVREQSLLLRHARILTLRSPSSCAGRVLELCGLSTLVEQADRGA